MYTVGNVYAIAAVAVVGGALFGRCSRVHSLFSPLNITLMWDFRRLRYQFHVSYYLDYGISLLLQPRSSLHGYRWKMLWSIRQRPRSGTQLTTYKDQPSDFSRRDYCFHARWLMARRLDLRLPFRFIGEEEGHPGRSLDLVCRFHPYLCLTEHRHVGRGPFHQRSGCRDMQRPGARLHQ